MDNMRSAVLSNSRKHSTCEAFEFEKILKESENQLNKHK
jgi:hypothetical protein